MLHGVEVQLKPHNYCKDAHQPAALAPGSAAPVAEAAPVAPAVEPAPQPVAEAPAEVAGTAVAAASADDIP